MIMGSKARLKAFNAVRGDAETIGHAVIAATPALRARLCAATLDDLAKEVEARKAQGKKADVQQRSGEDLLRAMHRLEIEPVGAWEDRLKAVVAADARAAEVLRAQAEKARLKLQRQRDFERWEEEQKAGGAKLAPRPAAPPDTTEGGHEDE